MDPDQSAELAAFLRGHPPFDALGEQELGRVAAAADGVSFPAGGTILSAQTGPLRHLWVIRAGAVEVIYEDRVLDLLGPGETFGQTSMISGLPPGFDARATQPTCCLKIPAEVLRPLLARPEVLEFIARSIGTPALAGADPSTAVDSLHSRAATLIRAAPVLVRADEPIRAAAALMTAKRASALLVRSGGTLGIVTDRDFRARVVAAGVDLDAPVSTIMTAPAFTVTADRLGADVLLDLLERGIHHVPVLSASGQILGVLDDADLVAAQARRPFLMRRAISESDTCEELVAVAAGIIPMTAALRDAQVEAQQIAAIVSIVLDALTRRLLELAVAQAGPAPTGFTWLALGSRARREAVPSSDVDSALTWQDTDGEPAVRGYLTTVASAVEAGLAACGMRSDANGVRASSETFARPAASWRRLAQSLGEDPGQDRALILASVLADSRPVWSTGVAAGAGPGDGALAGAFLDARDAPILLRLLARYALSFRPPTGFLRDFVVEHSGEHRGRLDIKNGGLIPIAGLARWAGLSAGVTSTSTVERLRAAEAAGVLDGQAARSLLEAHRLVFALRLDHQLEQLRQEQEPDDFLDPKTLNPLTRSYLREAFRAVASVQSQLVTELRLGIR